LLFSIDRRLGERRFSPDGYGAPVPGAGATALTLHLAGKGLAGYVSFLPGLSYFKPAIPKRPVDRGASDDTMAHFIPTNFDPIAASIISLPVSGVQLPVVCSEPLVETTVIEAKSGVVIPLVNWSKGPVRGLTVTVSVDVPTNKVELASGKPVKVSGERGKRLYTLDLDVADALILR
jgi:hypothetical protein